MPDTSIQSFGGIVNVANNLEVGRVTAHLYFNPTTGRVGVGTTNPGYKLDVRGTSNVGPLTSSSLSVTPGQISASLPGSLSVGSYLTSATSFNNSGGLALSFNTSTATTAPGTGNKILQRNSGGGIGAPAVFCTNRWRHGSITTSYWDFSTDDVMTLKISPSTWSPGILMEVRDGQTAFGASCTNHVASPSTDSYWFPKPLHIGRSMRAIQSSPTDNVHYDCDGDNNATRGGMTGAGAYGNLTFRINTNNDPESWSWACTTYTANSAGLGGNYYIVYYPSGNWSNSGGFSDRRIKHNVRDVDADEAHNTIMSLKPVSFTPRISSSKENNGAFDHIRKSGFIAQDVANVDSKLVVHGHEIEIKNENDDFNLGAYGIDYHGITAYATASIKKMTQQISSISERINNLEKI